MTLGSLRKGVTARIVKNRAEHELKQRLLALGFIRGRPVEILARSVFGATIVVRLDRHSTFSLRRSEAEKIEVAETTGDDA